MNAVLIGCAVLAAATYGAFIWAAYVVFVRRTPSTPKLTLLKVGALISAVVEILAILTARVHWPSIVAGSVLYFAALGLFFWCVRTMRPRSPSLVFSDDVPTFIEQSGPYRWIRHPFYASYLLSYVAGWVLSQQHALLIVIIVMTAIYMDAASLEERKFARSGLATAYTTYRSRTGMFWPRLSLRRR